MMISKLEKFLFNRYSFDEFPSLTEQMQEWQYKRPLNGIRVLDATPIFYNTGLKYLALLKAGADVTLAFSSQIPYDSNAIDFYRNIGMKIVEDKEIKQHYDVICDCAGIFAKCQPIYGFVELTRSGFYRYQEQKQPVFFADGGKIKRIETIMGTGNGVLRALQVLGYQDFNSKKVLVFGGGKVGSGVAMALYQVGAEVCLVDEPQRVMCHLSVIDMNNRRSVIEAIKQAFLIVTATGIKDAVANYSEELNQSQAILCNVGAEDEYGRNVPTSRVLCEKRMINFVLEEPTALRYIEPTMALNNYGVELLVNNRCHAGINMPKSELEGKIFSSLKKGTIAVELEHFKEFF